MNHKMKLGYTLLGAGIMALGITIGQFITPNIEAQNNDVFNKITCRELEVVDKDRNKAIVLKSYKGNNTVCTAIGNLGHSLNQDCDTMPIRLKGAFRWQNVEDLPLNLRRKLL